MPMPEISASWLALIGALLGGSGLKVIEYWLNKSKVKDDSATSFRKELREEVTSLREELRKAEAELDAWRDKYYKLMDEYSQFKRDHG
jgi:predicted nuclease with TOPRIM domain